MKTIGKHKFHILAVGVALALAFIGGTAARDSGLLAEVPGSSALTGAPAQDVSPAQIRQLMTGLSDLFEQASSKVSAFVVPIFAEAVVVTNPQNQQLPEDALKQFFGQDFFRRFFQAQPQRRTVRSLGSGVIVSKDGHILTNNHVVAGANKLTVLLSANQSYEATVIGTDPLTDLAVIKIEGQNLPFAVLGDSDNVKVGEWVIAVGNPFELLHTVTHGIISAKGRSSVEESTYENFLQTDAPINPGNSGGALANLDGEVIGINTAITSPSGGNVGLGFAIPINTAKTVMRDILANGKVIRGYLGILPQDITEGLAKALKLGTTEGALISQVTPGTPAAKAGLKVGDVIVEFDGRAVTDSAQLRALAAGIAPGKSVPLVVLRDGRKVDLTATLVERPPVTGAGEQQQRSPGAQTPRGLGLTVETLTPDIARQLGIPAGEKGAVITDVASGSVAEDAGLKPGDLIKEINRTPIRSAEELQTAIGSLPGGSEAALLIQRGQATAFVAIKIP